MEIHHKEGCLLYAQADHLSGEELGCILETLYDAGACNVQVVPTVTKKGRAAHLIVVDVHPGRRDSVENVLILDVRVTGWHVIRTEHRYLKVEHIQRKVRFFYEGETFDLEIEAKKAYGLEISIRPEYRSCEKLKKKLKERGKKISIRTCDQILREIVEKELKSCQL